MTFDQFELPPSIAGSLKRMNFLNPTPIQAQCIPPGLEGRDVLGMAQTGTGKTGAFGVPLAVRLMNNSQQNALILAPTRELAMQIHAFMTKLAGDNWQLKPALIIGGQSMKQQVRELRGNPRIFIATPGRLVDHLGSNSKLLAKCSILVLDEADRMMDMGFLPQIRNVIKALPRDRQTLMFSATFPGEIKALAQDFMRNPVHVSIGQADKPIEKIEQTVVNTGHKQKNEMLLDELNAREGSILIFTRTKHRTDRLARFLDGYGYKVARIHGDRSQGQRRMAIEGFRAGHFKILVATDIASRGLDISSIEHVVNYDLPQVPEDYVHRIGRTGRNGRDGRSLTFLVPEDREMWDAIQKVINKKSPGSQPTFEPNQKREAHAQLNARRQQQQQRHRPGAPKGKGFKKPFKKHGKSFGNTHGKKAHEGQRRSQVRDGSQGQQPPRRPQQQKSERDFSAW